MSPFYGFRMSSELRFKLLEMRNFLSVGNAMQSLELDGHDSILVIGRNLDIPGAKNGCGKTTIINALCTAVYNKPFDNISLQRLINTTNASKHTLMELRLIFEKDGNEYEIYRTRGSEIKTEVFKNGEDITPGKGVYETDALIESIIGISYDMFTKTVIFSGASRPFLELPIQQQRVQIEELFNISMLSEKAVALKEKIRNTESDIKIAEAVLQQQQGAISVYEKQVTDAEKRVDKWEVQRKKDIDEITEVLSELDSVDIDAQQKLHIEKGEIQSSLNSVKTNINSLVKDKKQLEKTLEKLMNEQDHLLEAKCPYCTQPFADAASKLEHIDAETLKLADQLEDISVKLEELSITEKDLNSKLKELNSKITHADISELIEARTNKTVLVEKLATLRVAVNPHIEPLEKLIETGAPEADFSKVDALKKLLDHQNFLLKLLTDKNSFLRQRIINKTIPLLNTRLNFYTSKLGLPHLVKFDANMSCMVSEFGRELDFGNLSAGEKKRVNISMSLAFRDVLHHLHAKINLLMIDEIDGGSLDDVGVESVLYLLRNKASVDHITTFIISHHPLAVGRMDRTLVAQKENGFTSIFYE